MAKPERPKSRLPDGRINPEYTAWRKKYALKVAADSQAEPIAVVVLIDKVEPLHEEPSEIITLRCVKLARNTTFVYCALGDGVVGVKVKRGIGPKLLKKTIKVRKEGETYVHVP